MRSREIDADQGRSAFRCDRGKLQGEEKEDPARDQGSRGNKRDKFVLFADPEHLKNEKQQPYGYEQICEKVRERKIDFRRRGKKRVAAGGNRVAESKFQTVVNGVSVICRDDLRQENHDECRDREQYAPERTNLF